MTIESAVSLRRIARTSFGVLIAGLLMCGAAKAQLPIKPGVPVTVGSVVPFGHGSTGQWSQIYSVKVAHNGSVLFLDTSVSNLYQWAPGAASPTLVVGPAATGQVSNGSTLEAAGSYWNSGMALDANDTLYITDRYGSAVHFLRVPYNAASGTWLFSSATNWTNAPTITLSGVPTAIEPQDVAIDCDSGFPCTMYVSWSNSGEIDKLNIDANGNTSNIARVITQMETDASNLAVDHAGNLFFLEAAYTSPGSRVTGVREIPATATLPITGDSTGAVESSLTRIDPAGAGFNFKGMTFDAAGNLYLSSENDNNSYGGDVNLVLMVPNTGTPTAPNLVWADAVEVAPVAAGFPVAIDPRGYLWIPNGNSGSNWAPAGTQAPPCSSANPSTCTTSGVTLWVPGSANIGTTPIGTAGATEQVFYSFSAATTPSSFSYATGAANFKTVATNPNPDPTVSPAVQPCTAGTTYPAFSATETTGAAFSWCSFFLTLNPQTAGNVTGELQILDSGKNTIAGSNVYLHGIGQGAAASVLSPAASLSVATGLQSPNQVAGDALGNSYVADSTLADVEMYPPGSSSVVGTAIGTGLTAPTGVAVDGAGDVYIGDSGRIVEIPFINGSLSAANQTTLLTGLGNHLNLAADGAGNVFVADKDKKQVVKVSNPQMAFLLQDQPVNTLGAGITFTGPSAIATDNTGNVYVADGGNLWELTPAGGKTEITSSLSAPVTGLAVDPSGSVFVAEATGIVWIPYETSINGLNVNGALQVVSGLGANNALSPSSVALDGLENAYVTYGSGSSAGLAQLGNGGSVNFNNYEPIVPYLQNEADAQVFNLGNAPLTFTAFSGDVPTGANASYYSVADATANSPVCDPSTPIAPAASCYLGLYLTAQAAGPSSASVAVGGNAANAPAGLNIAVSANAVQDLRNATTTAVSITPASGAIYPGSETIKVTVTANTPSNGTPGGDVVLSISGLGRTAPTALANGVATFTYNNLLGGTYTVTADYEGSGTAGVSPNFAVSAGTAKFTIVQAQPTIKVGAPAGSTTSVTVWNGSTYVSVGSNDTITATVTSAVGTPTGTVSFNLANGHPADPTQTAISLNANGSATFSTANLTAGVYNLTVVYSGDVNYASVNVALPSFQVIVPSVQITSTPSSLTITPGTPTQVTLTLKPLVGFNEQVGIQCVTSTLPQYSECTFAYPQSGTGDVGVGNGTDPTAPTTIVMTISTNVPVNGGTALLARPASWTLAGFFSLGLLGLVAGRRKFNRYLSICIGILFASAFMGLTSCTNAGYSTPPPAPKVLTSTGTYQVQVITTNPQTGQQNSLATPLFTLPTTVN